MVITLRQSGLGVTYSKKGNYPSHRGAWSLDRSAFMSEVIEALVVANGDNSFLIPYELLYETVFGNMKPVYFFLVTMWIVILFYCMYSIADRHFTWALEHLSSALRLSPDLAGLTLLAFGNGAPDFFTAVFGTSEEPEMILGSSVGSGLFIVTVVFGLTLLMAKRPGQGRVTVEENGNIQPEEPTTVMNDKGRFFKCTDVRHHMDPVSFVRSAGMYLFCIGFLFLFAILRKIPIWLPALLLSIYAVYLASCIALYFGAQRCGRRLSRAASEVLERKVGEDERSTALAKFQRLSCWSQFSYAVRTTCWRENWALESAIQKALRLILVILRAPADLILNLTILPLEVPEEATEADNFVAMRFLHRLRCIVNPFFSIFWYIFLLLGPNLGKISWYVWMLYGISSCLLSVALFLSTSWTGPPRFFPLHVFYSFCTSILWIYATSSELLACLSSTGSQLGISHTVMGILVLAWGNSFGDLVADVAIAKNGSFETAVSAIFSGPVQNVLLTIGAGFLIATIRSPSHALSLSTLPADMYIALVVLAVVVLLCLILIPFKFDFVVPRTLGIGLLTAYALYLPCALIVGLGIVKLPFL